MSFTYRASVLFSSGHIELIEFDVKKITVHLYSRVHVEVKKLREIDPVYEGGYWIIDCPCIVGNGHNMVDRWVLAIVNIIKKAGVIDTYDLVRRTRSNYGHVCQLLFALDKLGWVVFDYKKDRKFGNRVAWTGEDGHVL